MITAQEARSISETKRELTKDEFIAKHSSFLEKLEKAIREQCVKGNDHLKVVVRDEDNFTANEYAFLIKYMSELGYLTRSGDENHHWKSFETWWREH